MSGYELAVRSLEGEAGAELDLSSWRRDLSDRAKAGGIDEAVGCSQIGVVESVEELTTGFKLEPLRQVEDADETEVHGLRAGAVHRVAPYVAESIRSRGRERGGIEQGHRVARAVAEDGLTCIVGANGVLANRGAGVRHIAKNRNGQRET